LPFHAIERQPHPHTGRKPEKSQLAHIHTENRKHESKAFFSISIARPKTVLVIDFERYTEKSSGRDAKRAGFGGFFHRMSDFHYHHTQYRSVVKRGYRKLVD
jgi:hypothetical protein